MLQEVTGERKEGVGTSGLDMVIKFLQLYLIYLNYLYMCVSVGLDYIGKTICSKSAQLF